MFIPKGSFWAKLDHAKRLWHPLMAHSADAAAVMHVLVTRSRRHRATISALFGVEEVEAIQRMLVFLMALHDIGKAHSGFQNRRFDPLRRSLDVETGHQSILLRDWYGVEALEAALERAIILTHANVNDAEALLQTVFAHHGRPIDPKAVTGGINSKLWKQDPDSGRDPIAEIHRIISAAEKWSCVGVRGPVPKKRLRRAGKVQGEALMFVNGLFTLCDWLASNTKYFPMECADVCDTEEYWQRALKRAEDAVHATDTLEKELPRLGEAACLFERMFPETFGPQHPENIPTPLQQLLASLDLTPGSIVVVEDEPGSGKTEGVLVMNALAQRARIVSGFGTLLPTRATAGQMHVRVSSGVRNLYEGAGAPHVQLAVGGLSSTAVFQTDSHEDLPWASENSKRYLASEYFVGTVDQALLGALPINHASFRLASLAGKFIVIDEVHAYDRYMLVLLKAVINFVTATGGIVVLVSATLASPVLRRLLEGTAAHRTFSLKEAIERPYPAVTICSRDGRTSEPPLPEANHKKSVIWSASTEKHALQEAAKAAREGARVCVIRNRVKDVRTTVSTLVEMGAGDMVWRAEGTDAPTPYHARYAPEDRAHLDGTVVRDFGKDSAQRGVILVATQVVEQSLDVDFDLLVSDLCPIDVLLQRIGRLHRHDRRRPSGYGVARVIVICPSAEEMLTLKPKGRDNPMGLGIVYSDLADLELTRRLILASSEINIPEDNRRLVESVYHEEARAMLTAEDHWKAVIEDADADAADDKLKGSTAVLRIEDGYVETAYQYSQDASLLRTRIGGLEMVRVPLPEPVQCRFATGTTDFVDLPHYVVASAGFENLGTAISEPKFSADGVEFRIGAFIVRYGGTGWEWEKAETQP